MTTIRAGLRLWVTAWLVFQVASLSALVPRACCAAHRPPPSATEHMCHEAAAPVEQPDAKCSMRGMCEGPMAALLALLSNYGVPADPFEMSPDLLAGPAAIHARESLIGRLASPDPPPPRA